MLSPIQQEFANFVKEEFGYDIIEVPKEESDTFESILKMSLKTKQILAMQYDMV